MGAQKGGTTALDGYLRCHPHLCMPRKKELHFFDRDSFFELGQPDYEWYEKQFSPNSKHRLLGETTPAYMFWLQSPKRIRDYNPNMRLIFLLRNPIERAYSHWNMQRTRGWEKRGFLEAVDQEINTKQTSGFPSQNRRFSYIDRGYYSEQICRVRSYFPDQQLLFLKSETFFEDPGKVLEKIFGFLGLDGISLDSVTSQKKFQGSYTRPLSLREKGYLKEIYREEILKLERLLHWDCSNWLDC